MNGEPVLTEWDEDAEDFVPVVEDDADVNVLIDDMYGTGDVGEDQ